MAIDGVVVGEDADDVGSAFGLAVEPFEAVRGMELRPMSGGKAHVGEDVGLGLVHEGREPRSLGLSFVGDLAPLGLGGFGAVLRERR